MTMIAMNRVEPASLERAAAWNEVEPGFWAGNDAGEFLGTIEARGSRYVAYDAKQRHLGEFDTLARAQARAAGAARD